MISKKPAIELIGRIFDPKLGENGFFRVTRDKWVNSELAPIRQVILLQALKGATIYPRWCLSLDFVPHQTGGRLRWHRTPKSALENVSLDPMDFGRNPVRFHMSYWPDLPSETEVQRVLQLVLSEALPELSALRSLKDIAQLLDRLKAHTGGRGGRYGYDMHYHHRIAAAFVFAKLGDEERARDELANWTDLDQLISTDRERLDRLFEEALAEGRA